MEKNSKGLQGRKMGAVTLFCSTLLLSTGPFNAAAEVKVGVNTHRGELAAMTQWAEFGKYLSAELGEPVKIVPLLTARVVGAAAGGEVDLVLANPIHVVVLQQKHGATPLATLNGKFGTQFAGVIVAKKGSGITKGVDLKGKSAMGLDPKTAAGAYLFQAYHLKQQGIDVQRDLSFKEGKKQDDLVLAVQAGIIDAAFVRTGQLEAMVKEGKIKLDEFVIVDQRSDDNFPFPRSTSLYPEWFLCALAKLSPAVSAKVKAAVLKLTPDAPAAKAADFNGFVPPLALDGLKAAMKAMKIPPYDGLSGAGAGGPQR